MTIRQAYTQWAVTYDLDRNPTRDLDQHVTRQTLSGGHYPTILELGCGTGKNTPFLSGLCDRLLAFDFSEGMIAQARAKVAADQVWFSIADFTDPWPCADHAVDLIVCNLVLEHIESLGHIFGQARRALKDGGRFFVCELHPFRQYQGKKATFQHEGGAVEIPAYVHHLSSFTDAAQEAGFTIYRVGEWWDGDDQTVPPRLVSVMAEKRE